jgi:hypothetical protein
MAEIGPMRSFLTALSLFAILVSAAAIALSFLTHAPRLAFRIVAAVLLIDQATLALLYTRLPTEIPSIRTALRVGSALVIAAGALVIVWSALPHGGPGEIAMPAVGAMMIAHGVVTLLALRGSTRSQSV